MSNLGGLKLFYKLILKVGIVQVFECECKLIDIDLETDQSGLLKGVRQFYLQK